MDNSSDFPPCPPGTSSVTSELTVNGRTETACTRPDGVRHGPSVTRYPTGVKAAAGGYRDGLKDGEWTFWHEDGQVSGRGAFRESKPEGPWITWHPNGAKESEGVYEDGKQHGDFTYWDRDGQIVKTLHYDHGDLKSVS